MVALFEAGGALFALEFASAGKRVPTPGTSLWLGVPIAWRPAGRSDVVRQIGAYFAGSLRAFELALSERGSDFQRRVWSQLQLVAYGETITYRELADRVGRKGASRAAGGANAANPFAIVVPCHRVVGSNGHLTGYAGGLELKAALIAHERRH
jgi:methylated-DNA-[protein]-cysteine S-methyltransferase